MPATNQHPSHSPARSTGAAANSSPQNPISQPVPYFCQRGSATAEGLRMCFSSTCAMAAEYLRLVRQFGDTTEAHAQIEALQLLGIPIPVGWLHQGPVIEPRGGGHWSLVIGGGYVSTAIGSGCKLRYSLVNWGRRWMVEGLGTGWWLDLAG
jgi:hypothetical protein